MKTVLFVEEQMKQYRVPLYAALHRMLGERDIRLLVAYSPPSEGDSGALDCLDLSAEYGLKVRGRRWLQGRLLYQPLLQQALAADLVILDQGNRFLLNYPLLLLSLLGMKKVAFWGMGPNRLAEPGAPSERLRRWTTSWVSWWFAYTSGTAEYVAKLGFPAARITNVNNSTDSVALRMLLAGISESEKLKLRAELGIGPEDPVAVFCGRLHPMKNLPFLLQSARRMREMCPRFHLILIGPRPEEIGATAGIETSGWVHCAGPRFGREKAALFSIADLLLMPGAVGLVIVDAFAAGLPLLTTVNGEHGPEIEYLESGVNGLMTSADIEQFATATSDLLSRRDYLAQLRRNAWNSGGRYSIEEMAHKFSVGIVASLKGAGGDWADRGQQIARNSVREGERIVRDHNQLG
jgi:glycosyltransferase involved in cell wall biosynthesis